MTFDEARRRPGRRIVLNRFRIDFCRQICTARAQPHPTLAIVDVVRFMLRLLSSQNVTNSSKLQANSRSVPIDYARARAQPRVGGAASRIDK